MTQIKINVFFLLLFQAVVYYQNCSSFFILNEIKKRELFQGYFV